MIELSELIPEPAVGRTFRATLRPGIADVTASGRARLDAITRWLQDVAYADVVDAGLDGRGAWVVRRLRIRVEAFPRFGEELTVSTFCSGIGRFSAERRTTIAGGSAAVEAVALWVYLDAETWRPLRFESDFAEIYSESAAGRGANVRLRHPDPPEGAVRAPWTFRASDLDIAGHVNNSHYWDPLEQELSAQAEPERIDVEIEHRAPADAGEAVLLRGGTATWIMSPEGELHASLLRAPDQTSDA